MNKMIKVLMVVLIITIGCKKETTNSPESTSLNIIHAGIDIQAIKVNYFGKPIRWATYTGADGTLNYAANKVFNISNASNAYPLGIVSSTDTSKVLFNGDINIEQSKIYSMYLIGLGAKYEMILKRETDISYGYTDMAVAVRFINLSPNSPAVNITLASSPTINETVNLNYKQQTEFRKYALPDVIPAGSVTFQVRDAVSNAILTTYTLPTTPVSLYTNISVTLSRYKSITLAIKGLVGTATGTNAYGVFPIANY